MPPKIRHPETHETLDQVADYDATAARMADHFPPLEAPQARERVNTYEDTIGKSRVSPTDEVRLKHLGEVMSHSLVEGKPAAELDDRGDGTHVIKTKSRAEKDSEREDIHNIIADTRETLRAASANDPTRKHRKMHDIHQKTA